MAHKKKAFDKQLKRARQMGCIVIDNGGVKVSIKSPSGELYIAHRSERGMHPVRRFLNSIERATA
jgi:hypothetical protein